MLIKLSAPTSRPVTLDEFKRHIDVEHDDQDETIQIYLDAATDHVASACEQVLAPVDIEQREDCWPRAVLLLEAGPVRGIDEVAYLDGDGVEQVVDPSNYDWQPHSTGAQFWFVPGFARPALAQRPGSLRIRFAAGFNDPAASEGDPRLDLPRQGRQAILLLAAHWYRNREAVGNGAFVEVPLSAQTCINQLRVWRA